MAKIWFGHFDSTEEDPRLLLAEDWAAYFRSFITNGVKNGGTNLQVTSTGTMNVNIGMGVANIEGYIFIASDDGSGPLSVEIPLRASDFPRIDRVVLRLDRSVNVRSIAPVVISGVAAQSPSPPPLTRNSVIYEISLAQIRVNAGAQSIQPAHITDERLNTSVCGLMNSVLGIDTSLWQAQFDTTLQNMQNGYAAQTLKQQNDWVAQTNTQQSQWATRTAAIESDYAAWKRIINDWKDMTISELNMTLSFSFDNQLSYPGTRKQTSIVGKQVNESIVFVETGKTLAQQTTTISGSTVETTQTVYYTDGTVFRRVKKITTISGNSITEEVINL